METTSHDHNKYLAIYVDQMTQHVAEYRYRARMRQLTLTQHVLPQ